MVEYSSTGDPARSLELLWREGERESRGGVLSVDSIVEAAIAIADADGLAVLSMRRVAEQLGVGTMSLYTHVPAKAELLDLMLDTVLGETARPAEVPGGWRARLEQIARANWQLHLRHRWIAEIAGHRPPLGPNLIEKYEYELGALEGIGLSDVEMDSALTLVLGFVHGTARGAAEHSRLAEQTGTSDAEWWEATAPVLERLIPEGRYPLGSRVGSASSEEYGAAYSASHAFEFGLQRVLDGIGMLVDERGGSAVSVADERSAGP